MITKTKDAKKGFGWGLEIEMPLTSLEGNPLYIDDFNWQSLNDILKKITPEGDRCFQSKYPGNDGHNFYLEGFDVCNEEGELIDLKVKGVEMRTGVHTDLDSCLKEVLYLFSELKTALKPHNLSPSIIGGHPSGYAFHGERQNRSFDDWKAAEVTMITAGLHVNLSLPKKVEAEIDLDACMMRFDYLAPGMALFSLNSPFMHGKPWELPGRVIGKSTRSFLRSFYRHVLTAKPGILGTRFHVSAFDMTHSLSVNAALSELCMGVLLSKKILPFVSRTVRSYNISEMAKYGYDAKMFNGNTFTGSAYDLAKESLLIAKKGLKEADLTAKYLNILDVMCEKKELYADKALEEYYEAGEDFRGMMLSREAFIDVTV